MRTVFQYSICSICITSSSLLLGYTSANVKLRFWLFLGFRLIYFHTRSSKLSGEGLELSFVEYSDEMVLTSFDGIKDKNLYIFQSQVSICGHHRDGCIFSLPQNDIVETGLNAFDITLNL